MRLLTRVFLGLLLVTAVVFGLERYAAESREVVVMGAPGDDGALVETRLWVVDHGGHAWLRGDKNAGWYQRLTAAETIELTRGAQTQRYRAETVTDARAEINQAMRAKYGWADSYISKLVGGRAEALPIKLLPASD